MKGRGAVRFGIILSRHTANLPGLSLWTVALRESFADHDRAGCADDDRHTDVGVDRREGEKGGMIGNE